MPYRLRSCAPSRASRVALAASAALAIAGTSAPSHAFTTRVHLVIANDVRESLIAGDGRTLTLRGPIHGKTYRVLLSEADATAILRAPLAFRAGAIGPDNLAFPAMTDPSHALYQRPFVQCEQLYRSAANDEERAFAIGCFLHGASDAVAHHFVNYLTGETFTLTPLEKQRQQAFDNVVGHIQAETIFQLGAVKQRPAVFEQAPMTHVTPQAFIARNYFNTKSDVYPTFAGRAEAKVRAEMTRGNKSFLEAANFAGLGPAEHLSLVPLYLAEIDGLRTSTRARIEASLRALQDRSTTDGARLQVGPGPDGRMGTKDDTTACAATCAAIYAQYFVSVGLLAPRQDAGGGALPSAFDKVSDKLGEDLRAFTPAYLTTADRVSVKFNTPITASSGGGFDLTPTDIPPLFEPMTTWAQNLTTIDYRTLSQAVVPGWITAIENALQSVGVNVSVPDVTRALLDPFIRPVRDMIQTRVIQEARTFVETLTAEYRAKAPADRMLYERVLRDAAPEGQTETVLERPFDSGIYVHAFNLVAATLANHDVMLPGDWANATSDGPASFDTSYSPAWSQAGLCEYLREAVFPFGLSTTGLLSMTARDNPSVALTAKPQPDSPVECHGGAIDTFSSEPNSSHCELTDLGGLISKKTGSLTRGYPPALASGVMCRNIVVPGLPGPPPGAASSSGAAPGSTGSSADGAGCGCHSARAATPSMFGVMVLLLLARRISRVRGVR